VDRVKLSIKQAQDTMGFRLAVQSAFPNFIIMAHSGTMLSPEEAAAGRCSLSPVDRAFGKLQKK